MNKHKKKIFFKFKFYTNVIWQQNLNDKNVIE